MLRLNVFIDGHNLFLSTDITQLKHISFGKLALESLDIIDEISVTKNLVIITTFDPVYRENPMRVYDFINENREKNNINAYDWDGNHLWNIGEIVGDLGKPFWGGFVTTIEVLRDSRPGFDESLYRTDHDYYIAFIGSWAYVIDLDDRRVVQKFGGCR